MFKLKDLENGLFELHTVGKAFEGTPKKIAEKAIQLGIRKDELICAMECFVEHGHSVAKFNREGTLYSTSVNFKKGENK